MSESTEPVPEIRLTAARYADGIGEPVRGVDPVTISAGLFDQAGAMPNSANLSNLFVAWGQFLDHDLSLSPENEEEVLTAPGLVAPLARSEHSDGIDGPRMPLNIVTWQIDGSQVYGSTAERAADLRSFERGHLRMGEDRNSDKGLMPNADPDSFMAGDISSPEPVFLAGDVRANENPALSALHTLMVREHNYWADRLAEEHPDWTDEQLYQGARQIVSVELQQITYDSWLPHLIGDAVGPDTGHDPAVNGQVAVEFATAAFRFGHTMVSSRIAVMNEDGSEAPGGDMAIMDAFFNPDPLRDGGIDAILRGQSSTNAQELDTKVVDDLNFFLSTPNGMTGFSLVALNLLRAEDHGLQSYVDTRAALLGDIDPATLDPLDFSIISADPAQQAALAAVYPTVFDVHLWVGGLAEDALPGTQMGPTFTHIIADQFMRTRAADPDFGKLDPALGEEIIALARASTLSDIILRNTEIDLIQDDPFVAMDRGLLAGDAVSGTTGADSIDLVARDIIGAVSLRAGDDSLRLSGGTRVSEGISLGSGADTVTMSSGTVTAGIDTGSEDDTASIFGSAQVDEIALGSGNDRIDISQSADVGTITAGSGDDRISIGPRAAVDTVFAGSGADRITLAHGTDVELVDGGSETDALVITGGNYRVDWQDDDPSSCAGTIVYLDPDGNPTGKTTSFRKIESVTCFTPGTRIITALGHKPVEMIRAGDLVWTLDAGLQPVRWAGRVTVPATGRFAPVRIAAGALGNSRTMEVSPQHRMMLDDWRCTLFCGEDQVLAPAIHLLNDSTITRRHGGFVDYIHLLCDSHQILFADGIPSESFHPGQRGLGAMPEASRDEILALFPQLAEDPASFGPAARPTARGHEAQLIGTTLSSDHRKQG